MTSTDQRQRARQALLAHLRQQLSAPAGAIHGYAEMLQEEVTAHGPEEILDDLTRVHSAAGDLKQMVDHLLDPDLIRDLSADEDTVAAETKLRHDLRTPINAIKGYSEMLLEDLQDLGALRLRADLATLLEQSEGLLQQIEALVDFKRGDKLETLELSKGVDSMVSALVESLRPVSEADIGRAETGSILVVDDLETNRSLLARRLARDGHRVSTAESGEQALDLLAVEDFDLVMLDLMMPGMNGFEVLARIKADSRLYKVAVIMISALDEMDSVVRCIEAGAEDYLMKPFNPVLLKARISAALEKKRWRERERHYLERLQQEKDKHERLLLNILPRQIVERLNAGETLIADRFSEITVLFSDLVGFTEVSSRLPPSEVVHYLNRVFSRFDRLVGDLGIEKIKMIGDSYMVVAGVPERRPDHAEVIAEMALRMMESLDAANAESETALQIRIGIHSGPAVAGIIGTHRFLYDVWGDTVNVASRLETYGVPSEIQVSEATAKRIGEAFELEERGLIRVKGLGRLKTYFLRGRRSPVAAVVGG